MTNQHPTPSPNHPLRVCYFGTYRAGYVRNTKMIAGLRSQGIEVIECHSTLWHGIEDRVQATSGGWRNPKFWLRLLRCYINLLKRYRNVGEYDVMVVGYPGQLDVFLARWLSKLRRKPLVWDVYMSIYIVARERNLEERSAWTVNMLRRIEAEAIKMPDLLIQDTQEYVDWWVEKFHANPQRFRLIPIGADNQIFKPIQPPKNPTPDFLVTYYGTFIPNHGVWTIIEAARLLKDHPDIHFELIGQGPDQPMAVRMAEEYELENVQFIEWLDKPDLVQRAGYSDLHLGVFGTTTQSLMTIHNKIYEGLAMKLAVVTGDSPTMRRTFVHKKHLFLVERANPGALAEAILFLKSEPVLRQQIAEAGYSYFQSNFTVEKLGKAFSDDLREAVNQISPA
jgi:glycosyltransferase involved in cell wall biosynthesis